MFIFHILYLPLNSPLLSSPPYVSKHCTDSCFFSHNPYAYSPNSNFLIFLQNPTSPETFKFPIFVFFDKILFSPNCYAFKLKFSRFSTNTCFFREFLIVLLHTIPKKCLFFHTLYLPQNSPLWSSPPHVFKYRTDSCFSRNPYAYSPNSNFRFFRYLTN